MCFLDLDQFLFFRKNRFHTSQKTMKRVSGDCKAKWLQNKKIENQQVAGKPHRVQQRAKRCGVKNDIRHFLVRATLTLPLGAGYRHSPTLSQLGFNHHVVGKKRSNT